MENDSHILELIPAYALECLERDEAQIVAAHLEECNECQKALSSFLEVAGQLAYAVPQVDPPASVKASLMRRVQAGQQPGPATLPRKSWLEAVQDFFAQLSPAWVIASLAVVGLLVFSNLFLWDQVRELRAEQQMTMAVVGLNATEFAPGSSGTIVISRDGLYGTLVVENLPILDETQQYQLWLIQDGQRTNGGVFSVGYHGYASQEIHSEQPLGSFTSFGITIEPAGGSPQPTGEKVLGGDL